jgi:hypothetical protein
LHHDILYVLLSSIFANLCWPVGGLAVTGVGPQLLDGCSYDRHGTILDGGPGRFGLRKIYADSAWRTGWRCFNDFVCASKLRPGPRRVHYWVELNSEICDQKLTATLSKASLAMLWNNQKDEVM